MPFLSATASKTVNGGGGNTGGYLSAGKLADGESMRFVIMSEEPLEAWTVWGENPEDKKPKPFRFVSEPSPSDIEAELGDFTQRQNYDKTGVEKPKFSVSCFVYSYESETIKVLEISQKGLMREIDALSQSEDYENLGDWDMTISRTGVKLNTEYRITPAPRRKGFQEKVEAAWSEAQEKGYDLKQLLVGGSPFGESA